jgi:VWFA-related protein
MRRPPFRPLMLFAAQSVLVLAAVTARAQDEPASIFIERVDVDVINVEVFVTDKSGQRVTGLVPEDFEIYEDGQPVEVSNFYAVAAEDRLMQDLARDRELIREGRRPRQGRPELPEDQQLNLMVYVDHYNLRPNNQARVLEQLEGFLEDRVAQGDNIMLVGYDRRLRVVQTFTRDSDKIAAGLKKMRKVATHGQIDDLERRQVMLRMARYPSGDTTAIGGGKALAGDDVNVAYQLVRSYVERVRNDLRYTLNALQSVSSSLAGLPGRKAILYVSDGLPQRPGEELYQQMLDLFGNSLPSATGRSLDPFIEALEQDETDLLNRITQQANAHQVTLYTLDARGAGGGTHSAEYADISAGAAGHTMTDNLRKLNLQEPLIALASATGGSAILNTYAFDNALGSVAQDFDSFYSLGYRSRHGGDGKYHKIDVRVKRDGLRIRHRAGFLDKPEVERVADRTLSSLILDLEKNPLGVNIDFGVPEKEGRGTFLLPVLIRIPFREITLLPDGEVEQGRLRIFLAVQDDEGGISETHEYPYPLTVPREQVAAARDREIGYSASLKLRRGVPKVAVGVWDELSGTESFVHKSLLIGEAR